jgi:hypothetical protein
MTQDEIIEMAIEAELAYDIDAVFTFKGNFAQIEAFAKLVSAKAAAKEREECAKVCMETEQKFAELSNKFSSQFDAGGVIGASQCLNAIRARGEA